MPRKLREDYPGAWHHVMNRGARRESIFADDVHVGEFLQALEHTVEHLNIEVHAYAVMPNHYHLLVHSVRGNLSRAMQHLGGRFTQAVNKMHSWDGPLFRGRFRSELINDDAHLLTVASYIHLNPIRAGLARRLDEHANTSHRAYIGKDPAPEWLCCDFISEVAGGKKQFAEYVGDLRSGARLWPEGFNLQNGMYGGAEGADERRVVERKIEDRKRAASLSPAEAFKRICRITGLSKAQILTSRHGRGANVARRFALWALRYSTDLTQEAMAAALGMSVGNVAVALHRLSRQHHEQIEGWKSAWLAIEEPPPPSRALE